ncbi:hypothetical protein [Okibacterium endophyticum]
MAENVWIGAGAMILPCVSIGRDAVVAAGAIVADDVPAASPVAGPKGTVRRRWRCRVATVPAFTPLDASPRHSQRAAPATVVDGHVVSVQRAVKQAGSGGYGYVQTPAAPDGYVSRRVAAEAHRHCWASWCIQVPHTPSSGSLRRAAVPIRIPIRKTARIPSATSS